MSSNPYETPQTVELNELSLPPKATRLGFFRIVVVLTGFSTALAGGMFSIPLVIGIGFYSPSRWADAEVRIWVWLLLAAIQVFAFGILLMFCGESRSKLRFA